MKGAGLLGFIFGFAAGSAATYFYLKSKEEVVEFKPEEKKAEPIRDNEFYRAAHETTYDHALNILKDAKENPVTTVTYSEAYNEAVEAKKDEMEASNKDGPRSIPPDMFGDNPDYGKFTLKYFKDGVLIDDQNNPLDDPDDVIGSDFVDHFGAMTRSRP